MRCPAHERGLISSAFSSAASIKVTTFGMSNPAACLAMSATLFPIAIKDPFQQCAGLLMMANLIGPFKAKRMLLMISLV